MATCIGNYIGLLNEYCQKRQMQPPIYTFTHHGEAHDPTISCCLLFNSQTYQKTASNKQLAKQLCAEQCYKELEYRFSDLQLNDGPTNQKKQMSSSCLTDETFAVQLLSDKAMIPHRSSNDAAGYDLFSSESLVLPSNTRQAIGTGIKIKIPIGTYARIASRSSMALKGIDVVAGVVDADYRGEVKVILHNFSKEDLFITQGHKIAQLILERIKTPSVVVVDYLPETKRGEKGFGSTGV